MSTFITICVILYYIYSFFKKDDEDVAPSTPTQQGKTATAQSQTVMPEPEPANMEQSERHIHEEMATRPAEPEAPKTHFDELEEMMRRAEAEQRHAKAKKRKMAEAARPKTLAEQAEERKKAEGMVAASNMAVKRMAVPEEGGRTTASEQAAAPVLEQLGTLTPEDLRRAVILDAIFKRPEF